MSKRDKLYIAIGRFLGYPECCIKGFMDVYKAGGTYKRKLDGTGYIPCEECNELTEEELIKNIKDNRKCKRDFPFMDFSSAVDQLDLSADEIDEIKNE